MFVKCHRCLEPFDADDEFTPVRICPKCSEEIEDDPDRPANVPLEGGGKLEVSEAEARRMYRFQQLIDAGYMPKEAYAKVTAEFGEFEFND